MSLQPATAPFPQSNDYTAHHISSTTTLNTVLPSMLMSSNESGFMIKTLNAFHFTICTTYHPPSTDHPDNIW